MPPHNSPGVAEAQLYRDIEIDSGKSLYDLAEGIVGAFDFDLDHAFGFYSKLTKYFSTRPSSMNCSRTWRVARATPEA